MLTFSHSHRVTYAECTIGNHVYYARYLELLEEARGELLPVHRHSLPRLQEQDTVFPVIACQLQFKATARYDDQIRTEIWIIELARVRLAISLPNDKPDGETNFGRYDSPCLLYSGGKTQALAQ